jgi:hypothetical protein
LLLEQLLLTSQLIALELSTLKIGDSVGRRQHRPILLLLHF